MKWKLHALSSCETRSSSGARNSVALVVNKMLKLQEITNDLCSVKPESHERYQKSNIAP